MHARAPAVHAMGTIARARAWALSPSTRVHDYPEPRARATHPPTRRSRVAPSRRKACSLASDLCLSVLGAAPLVGPAPPAPDLSSAAPRGAGPGSRAR
jgi:hypothetical protein